MLDFVGRAYAVAVTPSAINPNSLSGVSLTDFITRVISWVLYAAGVLVVVYLIYGGILYVTAGGDAEKATKGRTAVINAIIGLVIVLLALAIVSWVTNAARTSAT